MEYSLYMIYYLFQSFLNMVMEMEVSDGVPVGGLLIGSMILGLVLRNFAFTEPEKKSKRSREGENTNGK